MLQRKLRLLLAISYSLLLLFGLMPTTLSVKSKRLRICKVSKWYLFYSLCVSVVVLLQFLYSFQSGIVDGYMRNNIVLQWSLALSFSLRFAGFLSCYCLVWLQRQQLVCLFKECLHNFKSHWLILKQVAGIENLNRLQLKLANTFQRLLFVHIAMTLCSFLVQFQLLAVGEFHHFLVKAVQMLMISVIRIGVCTLLLLLNHQFEAVRLSLQSLHRTSLKDLSRIAAIHSKWFKLTRKAFGIYDLTIACVLINMFAANVSILYHAVQYGNKTIKSNIFGYITGDALIFLNTMNTVLVMNLVDRTISSCNNAAHILRQFNDLRQISSKSQMELELFMNRLQSNRLVYRICGCVVLDKPAFLSYMASVLNNVLILMQFDLKRSHSSDKSRT